MRLFFSTGGLLLVLTVTQLEPAPPTMTELDTAQLELLQVRTAHATTLLQLDACRAESGRAHDLIGRMRAERASAELTALEADLKAKIEARHPGYTWDPKTQAFTKK